MKTYMKIGAWLIGVIFTASIAAYADNGPSYMLKTSCTASLPALTGPGVVLTAESVKYSPNIEGFGSSAATLNFGPYVLVGSMSMNQPLDASSMEPTFEMSFYSGNPVQGQINEVRVQGLDLDGRALNQPLTLYGVAFVDLSYQGQAFGRVDYHCSITKYLP